MSILMPGRSDKGLSRTAELLMIVAMVAIGLAFGWPVLEHKLRPRVEVKAYIKLDPSTPGSPGLATVQSCAEYLRSAQAVEDVRNHPTLAGPGSGPTSADRKQVEA